MGVAEAPFGRNVAAPHQLAELVHNVGQAFALYDVEIVIFLGHCDPQGVKVGVAAVKSNLTGVVDKKAEGVFAGHDHKIVCTVQRGFTLGMVGVIDNELEERMELAQQISSMVLGLRRKVQLRVRQPLSKLIIPILNDHMIRQLDAVKNIILSEVNVKEIEYITDTTGVLVKKIKPNFKTLGPKYGKYMKQISTLIAAMEQSDIFEFEKNGRYQLNIGTEPIDLSLEDVEILSEDIPGWLVANEGRLTVALDINVTKELKEEGIARELINRIQNLRKESNFDVTDKITLAIGRHKEINEAVENFSQYIASQVLAEYIELTDEKDDKARDIEIDDIHTFIKIERIN